MPSVDCTIRIRNLKNNIELSPGMLLGVYRVLRKIGAGGMGAVYEVEHTMLHRHFALKTLFVQGDTELERQDCIDRFLLEARITSQLRHPGIVSVQTLEQDKETGALYFVMDYVSMTQRRRKDLLHSAFALDAESWRTPAEIAPRGERVSLSLEDLQQYGKRVGRRMNPELIRRLMMEMAETLDYAHNLGDGIIHRDIKPANILIREDGHAVLADFGVAKIADSCLRKNVLRGNDRSLSLRVEAGGESYHLILGTMEYMAPELRTGSPPSPQTDLYALGATLYQLLTGELPSGNAAKPSAYGHDPLWDEIIERCLAFSPDDRYPSLKALHDALSEFPKVARTRKWLRGLCRLGGGAAATAALMVPLALFLLRPAQHTAPTDEFRLPKPTPATIFKVAEGRRSAKLLSVHPDACGRLEIPATVKGKPLTEIAEDAFQNCPNLSGVYLPARLSAPPTLTSAVEEPNCQNSDCDTCRARRSLLLDVPPGTKPYLVLQQQTVPHAQAELPIGTTLTQTGISYRWDEKGWIAEVLLEPVEHLVFPDTIKGAAVYKIGNSFCEGDKTLRSVRLPEQLQEIGEKAFFDSGLLGEVILPGTLKIIRKAAFSNTAITAAKLPAGLEILEESGFQNTKIQHEVILPDGLKHLGTKPFCGVSLNQSVLRLPSALKTIVPYTFWHLGNRISRIEFPTQTDFGKDSLLIDGSGGKRIAFHFGAQQVSLATHAIVVNHYHREIELHFREDAEMSFTKDFIFRLDHQKFSGNFITLTVYQGKKRSTWTGSGFVGEVPLTYNGVAVTPGEAPDDVSDTHLTQAGISYRRDDKGWVAEAIVDPIPEHLVFPDSIKGATVYKIGDRLCDGRKEIKSVRLPGRLQEIGAFSFHESGLTGELHIPETVTAIHDGAFANIPTLSGVVLPPKLKTLGSIAFQNDKLLTNVALPDTITHFGDRVFCGINLDGPLYRIPPKITRTDPRCYWFLGDKVTTIELPSIAHLPPKSMDLMGTGHGQRTLTIKLNELDVTIDSRAIRIYRRLHSQVTLQFRPGAKVNLAPEFLYEDVVPMKDYHGKKYRITVRIGEQESVWNGTRFVGEAVFTYNNETMGPSTDSESTLSTISANDFIFRPEESELRILRYTGFGSWRQVTLPHGTDAQPVVVEADAFSGRTIRKLKTSGRVRFNPNAFRDATIEQIEFDSSKVPELTALSFNGIIGGLPACTFYNKRTRKYENSLVNIASMTLLKHNQNLYLLDYGNSKSATLKIPTHILQDGKDYQLYLLPHAFTNCPKLNCLILSAPCWQSPEVFSSIPSLSRIKLPAKYAEEADALREALHESGIKVEITW